MKKVLFSLVMAWLSLGYIVAEEKVKETDKKCPACGGVMDFNPATGKMLCPYCGTEFDAYKGYHGNPIESVVGKYTSAGESGADAYGISPV